MTADTAMAEQYTATTVTITGGGTDTTTGTTTITMDTTGVKYGYPPFRC
ncbi:MAG TPA: hypothetical protein VE621_00810 [Bryobacteraceae bacterium]|nr:hypothetical protein [Bryobacteraceae bacterium]